MKPDDKQTAWQALRTFPGGYGLAVGTTALAALARWLSPRYAPDPWEERQ